MNRAWAAIAVGLLACASTSPCPRPDATSAEENARIQEVARIGREVLRQDVACARASDALLSRWKGPPPMGGGWIARAEGDGFRVTFVAGPADAPELLGDVMVLGGRAEVALRPERALTDEERSMYRARQIAVRARGNCCSKAFNTVILPAPEGAWDVFVLAASSDAREVVFGGHSRVRVSGGGTLLEREPFSKSCLTMTLRPDDSVAITVTHLVSDVPAPTHVYLSLLHRKPIYVGANRPGARPGDPPLIWLVDGDRIARIR